MADVTNAEMKNLVAKCVKGPACYFMIRLGLQRDEVDEKARKRKAEKKLDKKSNTNVDKNMGEKVVKRNEHAGRPSFKSAPWVDILYQNTLKKVTNLAEKHSVDAMERSFLEKNFRDSITEKLLSDYGEAIWGNNRAHLRPETATEPGRWFKNTKDREFIELNLCCWVLSRAISKRKTKDTATAKQRRTGLAVLSSVSEREAHANAPSPMPHVSATQLGSGPSHTPQFQAPIATMYESGHIQANSAEMQGSSTSLDSGMTDQPMAQSCAPAAEDSGDEIELQNGHIDDKNDSDYTPKTRKRQRTTSVLRRSKKRRISKGREQSGSVRAAQTTSRNEPEGPVLFTNAEMSHPVRNFPLVVPPNETYTQDTSPRRTPHGRSTSDKRSQAETLFTADSLPALEVQQFIVEHDQLKASRKELRKYLMDQLIPDPEREANADYGRLTDLLNEIWEADESKLELEYRNQFTSRKISFQKWIDAHNKIQEFRKRTNYMGPLEEWIVHCETLGTGAEHMTAFRAQMRLEDWLEQSLEGLHNGHLAQVLHELSEMPKRIKPEFLAPFISSHNERLRGWFKE